MSAGSGVKLVKVDPDRAGQRLDNFLLGQLKGAPRSLIYRILRTGQVRVNGKRAKPDTRLEGGEEVRIPPVRLAEPGDPGKPAPALLQRIEKAILHEDRDLLVLDKPSGIASHGGSGISFGAIELMRQLRPDQSLELVHRLDRDTSGILLLAKKRSALSELQRMMREGGIEKRYLALLSGQVRKPKFSVDAPLEKSVLQGGERMVRVDAAGKESLSHFSLIDRYGDFSYVEVKIDTGRTHQIRVHSAYAGFPVAGDDKYGDKEANQKAKKVGLKRLFLHAATLSFALGDGERPYVLNAPLPDELKAVLDRLV
ncbi:RluA family pseudouridine synthase [Pseudomarimonas arenosa]|uniref:Pseudouridine synthase n=1 Tax=Pseudomarimonas arenosa TaxID=2774145 RepID=A0AAW3ZEG5_9GAMM|nr:RluA family pseudouridine synthase [Pseudomarimonas arenosa]MBD8524538.1 RluA family pseudouridine synthase [Pseudomarimonas arenosa]